MVRQAGVRHEPEVHAPVGRVAVEGRLGRAARRRRTSGGGVDEVAAPLHREVEVVVAEAAVAVVLLAAVLLGDDVGDLLREPEGLAAGRDADRGGQPHVRVVAAVVGPAVAGLVARGDRDPDLAVGPDAGVEVVDVPELHDVVLELEALREDPLQVRLVGPVEERRPPRVGVRQGDDVVVVERVGDRLGDDVAGVAVERQRRRVARLDPRGAPDRQLSHPDASLDEVSTAGPRRRPGARLGIVGARASRRSLTHHAMSGLVRGRNRATAPGPPPSEGR